MRFFYHTTACWLLLLAIAGPGLCQAGADASDRTKGQIVEKLESRYHGAAIQAEFVQKSTLVAMDITDTATGKAWFKHPGMMRWEYETPDAHAIISDGDTLWIHRPADNQVIVGNALAYFGNGKGASFLSNIGLVKEAFSVEKTAARQDGHYTLKLTPLEKELDLSEIYLNIDKKTFSIDSVITRNAYGDQTRIEFRNIRFRDSIPDSKFKFEIPGSADVMQMSK